jgi:hypothetical protein
VATAFDPADGTPMITKTLTANAILGENLSVAKPQ